MIASRPLRWLVLVLLTLSFVTPASAQSYGRYRKVYDAAGNPRFYKNIPIADFFKTDKIIPRTGPGGGATIKSTDAITVGSGSTAVVVATGTVKAVDVAEAVLAVSRGPVGVAVFALPLVAAWLLTGDTRGAPAGSPQPFETKDPSGDCTWNGICSEYSTDYSPQSWYGTRGAACNAAVAAFHLQPASTKFAENLSCGIYVGVYFQGEVTIKSRVKIGPPVENWVPATVDQVKQRMIDKPVPADLIPELAKRGASIPISYAPDSGSTPVTGPPQVSMPPVTQTSTSTSGDTTTKTSKTERTRLDYDVGTDPDSGRAVPRVTPTTAITTVTSVTNNTTNVTTVTEVKTETTTESSPDPEGPPSDSPMPALPVLYVPKYPDGLVGVWGTKKEQMKNSSFTQLARKLMPEVSTGGSCPTMQIDLSFSSWANFGTKDVAPPCYVWDWGKAIVIISALILARALVFGG